MIILIFIFGLIVGSFLNALIYRLHSGESIFFERSHCVYCYHVLGFWDLVPVFSFVFLGGRCRYCSKPISWQYPIVELITATSFVLAARNLESGIWNLESGYLVVVLCFLVIVAVYDYKHYLILDKVVFPALILATIWNIYSGHFMDGLYGALIVSGFFAVQYFFSKGRWIGFGDVKLGLFLGSLFGIKLSLIMLFLAYLLGAAVGILLILYKHKKLSSHLPFGVFLSASAIIMLLYGPSIAAWYFNLIGF